MNIPFVANKNGIQDSSPTMNYQGLFAILFGCWHARMSKPITMDGETYKYCLRCGVRRRYDLETFETTGGFYYPER